MRNVKKFIMKQKGLVVNDDENIDIDIVKYMS